MIVTITSVKQATSDFLRIEGDIDGSPVSLYVRTDIISGMTVDAARSSLCQQMAALRKPSYPDISKIPGQVVI